MTEKKSTETGLNILIKLFNEGTSILKSYDNPDLRGIRLDYQTKRWLEKTRVLFKGMFFNEKFYLEFERLVSQPEGVKDQLIDYEEVLNVALGHLEAVGKLFTYGYIRDSYYGIDNTTSKKAFVAMCFDSSLEDLYYYGIKPAIEEKIDTKILETISESRFLVADFTKHRGGVYYEAGYARGLGIPVIQVCHECDFENLHFDIKTINTVRFSNFADLRSKLCPHIMETIGRYNASSNETKRIT